LNKQAGPDTILPDAAWERKSQNPLSADLLWVPYALPRTFRGIGVEKFEKNKEF
jgi:hypothetical protein